MRGSRPRALRPGITSKIDSMPTQQRAGRGGEDNDLLVPDEEGEVGELRDSSEPCEGGEVGRSHDSSKPCEGGEVRESRDSSKPCEGGEVGASYDSSEPCGGGEFRGLHRQQKLRKEEKSSIKAQVDHAADRRLGSGRVKVGEMSPEIIKSVLDTATSMFSTDEILPRDALEHLPRESIASADGNYGIQEAVKWAEGFEFLQNLVDSDMRLFRASQLDFSAMVRRRLKKIGSTRLSAHRVEQLRPDNPERERLLDIASGMRVPLPVGFVPNGKGERTPLRPAYVEVHQAVDRMLADLHAQGLAFCLPKAEAIAFIDGLHLRKASWTPKKGKASGRSIGDMSFCDGTPLNCDESKQIAESWWGKIELLTIDEVVGMILEFYRDAARIDSSVRWEDLRIWKTDLRGAYQLMSLHPDFAKYFGMEIHGERIFIHLCGIFGWTCTPAAFQVVSRGIQWELKHSLKGRCKMYVDDIVGLCFAQDLNGDVQCAKDVSTSLLGPKAIAGDKTETGTRLDVLGCITDIEQRLESISRMNFLNAVYGFFTINLDKKVTLKTAEKLASWGSRYSSAGLCALSAELCIGLHPGARVGMLCSCSLRRRRGRYEGGEPCCTSSRLTNSGTLAGWNLFYRRRWSMSWSSMLLSLGRVFYGIRDRRMAPRLLWGAVLLASWG